MGAHRTVVAKTPLAAPPVRRPAADPRPRRADGHSVCAAERRALEHVAEGNGLWLGDDLLAPPAALATRRRVETAPSRAVGGAAAARPSQFEVGRRRQCLSPRVARGKKTGPNPTDRRKAGSKHHVLTDAHGIPLVARLTAANRHDVTQLLPLVDSVPPVAGRVGAPVRRPGVVQGDRGYDSQPHRHALAARGIASLLAKRGTTHGSGLGRTRWVVERTLAWLHRFRRLAVRYERRPSMHEAFLSLACSLICWYYLKPVI
jgi:transposase